MEHFSKFRNFLSMKWPGFIPLPQISLQILGKTNLGNDLKAFILNNFIKDICQYDFISDSTEFKAVFDMHQSH